MRPLQPRWPGRWVVALALLALPCAARAHDLMASHVILRLKPDRLELQIKIAADVAWPLVQEISPGAVFVSEDFEKVGRPLLLALARKLDVVALDGKTVQPTLTHVVVAEDTFLFAYTYPVPAKGTLLLKENYLGKMSPEYLSHVRVYDKSGALVLSKDLSNAQPSFELTLSAAKSAAGGAPTAATAAVVTTR